jgi:hypothetical protein
MLFFCKTRVACADIRLILVAAAWEKQANLPLNFLFRHFYREIAKYSLTSAELIADLPKLSVIIRPR